MMADRSKEIAKFASGAEAFHALIHAYFWYSGKTLNAFGVEETPTWHKRAAIGNALVSLALGLYAWGDNNAGRADEPAEMLTRLDLPDDRS